jgi:hypothetical protein
MGGHNEVVLREMYVHGKLTPNLEALQPIFEEQSEKVLCQMLINFIETFKTVKFSCYFFIRLRTICARSFGSILSYRISLLTQCFSIAYNDYGFELLSTRN